MAFTVRTERSCDQRATIVAGLKTDDGAGHRAPDQTVRYDFVREGRRWMIDDIRWPDGNSARAVLTNALKD